MQAQLQPTLELSRPQHPLEPIASVYTDASFIFKPQRGIYLSLAYIELGNGDKFLYYVLGSDKNDNNEIELDAVNKVMEAITKSGIGDYNLYTDSMFVVNHLLQPHVHHVSRELNKANLYIHSMSEYFRNKYLHSSNIDFAGSETFKQIE